LTAWLKAFAAVAKYRETHVPADGCQRTGESQRSAACLCFCGATIATVDEHIRSAHRGVGA